MATMTHEEWWSCGDPDKMLSCDHLRFNMSDRRLRLFVTQWCRASGWDDSDVARTALDMSERYADGAASQDDLLSARMAIYPILGSSGSSSYYPGSQHLWAIYGAAGKQRVTLESALYSLHRLSSASAKRLAAQALRDMVDVPRPAPKQRGPGWVITSAISVVRLISGHPGQSNPESEETPALELRNTTIDSDWRTSTAVAIAGGAYEERAFDRLPILADALQDAGCDDDDILNHLRDTTTPHVRGCWALDLVLGKS